MAQYQARQWQSWHRHMALVMLTMQFMLRLDSSTSDPSVLSCYDIQILLAKTLPDRRNSREEILRQLQIDTNSAGLDRVRPFRVGNNSLMSLEFSVIK